MFVGEKMSLQKQMHTDLITAIKAKDTEKKEAVRIIMGEFGRQNEKELSDDQVIAIIKKLVKSEKELLAAKGEDESEYIKVLESYLPQQATEEEIRAWIEKNIDFTTFGNFMQAMKPVMVHFGAAAEGNLVKKVLQTFK
ncbi:MAG: hypothetical protein ACI8PB_003278 [Desulforhopalus sp.]